MLEWLRTNVAQAIFVWVVIGEVAVAACAVLLGGDVVSSSVIDAFLNPPAGVVASAQLSADLANDVSWGETGAASGKIIGQ
eukprot:9458345-Pyramimonas_sp.AAC.1